MSTTKETIRFFLKHLRQVPHLSIPVAIILPINIVVNTYVPPLILAAVLNRLSTHDFTSGHIWEDFGGSLLLYLAIALFAGTVMWRIFDMFYWRLEGRIEQSIHQEVFRHLVSQSANFHANQFAGSLVSATNKLSSSYVRTADTVFFQIAPLFLGLTFVTIVMVFRAPLYTGLLLLFSILFIAVSLFVSRKVRKRGTELSNAESQQTGKLADALTNVMAIKSFSREREENRRFGAATNNTYSRLMAMMRAFQHQQMYLSSVTGIMSTVALTAAVVSVVSFGANVATAFLIFSYTSNIVQQLFTFSNNALRNLNRSFGDAADMIENLGLEPEVKDSAKPEKSRMQKGEIVFKDVTFSHDGADDALFQKLNLTIKPGEKVGLVGHSGSGKTTFTRLLMRFSDIDGGEIAIDGQNIAAVTQDDLRRAIAYVPQEPLLFHRSIRENIAYGRPGATEEEVEAAAKNAHAAEFIRGLPQGYDTLVGERGVKLSGGQRQRIVIARAMLKNAPILMLDEATSALDSESEALIQDALWRLMQGRTAIVIAHRLSTIQHMDRIIVLDNGDIVEEGSHAKLTKKGGVYAQLWARQSGGFIED